MLTSLRGNYNPEQIGEIEKVKGLNQLLCTLLGEQRESWKKHLQTMKELGYKQIPWHTPAYSTHSVDPKRVGPEAMTCWFRINYLMCKEDSAAWVLGYSDEGPHCVVYGAISKGNYGYTKPQMHFHEPDSHPVMRDPYFDTYGIRDFKINKNVILVDVITKSPIGITRIEIELNNQGNQTSGLEKIESFRRQIAYEARNFEANALVKKFGL